ncbi:type IV pilus modification protein PilV [Variovorax sp. GT1P44]|uniref:type IV pilus modification protein PilV n=1 Tax=Variovorax sp. GT1P44 TaxID=3443742 RepID=UPI003F46005C
MTNSHRSLRPRQQRGVAMIEVLVAVLLFSLGVLGLMGLQAQAIKYSVESEDRNRAALLANEIASAMWTTNTVASDANAWTARALVAPYSLPSAVVAIQPEPTVTNSANVTITWSPPQRTANEAATSRLTTRVTLPPPP